MLVSETIASIAFTSIIVAIVSYMGFLVIDGMPCTTNSENALQTCETTKQTGFMGLVLVDAIIGLAGFVGLMQLFNR